MPIIIPHRHRQATICGKIRRFIGLKRRDTLYQQYGPYLFPKAKREGLLRRLSRYLEKQTVKGAYYYG